MGTTKKNPTAKYDVGELLSAADAVLSGVIALEAGRKAKSGGKGKKATLVVGRVDKGCPPPEVVEVSRVDKGCPPPRQLTDLAKANNRGKKKQLLNRIQDVIVLLDAAKTILDSRGTVNINWDN